MLLFFLPPIVQVLIGVVVIAIGLAVHMYVIAGFGLVGIAVGATRYVRSRRPNGFQR
jgi:type IV secretory pathway TrbD component